jgi:hypothetical protein
MRSLAEARKVLVLVAGAVSSAALVACGGASDKSSETPDGEADAAAAASARSAELATAASPSKQSEPAEASVVPTDCKSDGKLCLPPPAFVKKLCDGAHPEVAFAFLRKGTPFTRAYLAGNTEAWNASGGASSSNTRLTFDEEVIVLVARKTESGSGIQVSGSSGGYDVLRWDGTCASLASEELTFKVPPKPLSCQILWKDLPTDVQDKLLEDPTIAKLNKERRDECKGISVGVVSSKCAKIVDKLSVVITDYVRGGGATPIPTKLP